MFRNPCPATVANFTRAGIFLVPGFSFEFFWRRRKIDVWSIETLRSEKFLVELDSEIDVSRRTELGILQKSRLICWII